MGVTTERVAEQVARAAQSQGPRTLSHVARIRVLAGHSQESLAEAAAVSRGTIHRLEHGHLPSAPTALRVTHALGYDDPLVVFPELLERP